MNYIKNIMDQSIFDVVKATLTSVCESSQYLNWLFLGKLTYALSRAFIEGYKHEIIYSGNHVVKTR